MNVSPDLDTRFRAAALAEGLVDVRFDVVDSPVGPLHLAGTDRGLARISYRGEGWEDELARQFGVRVLRSPLDDVRRELEHLTGDLPPTERAAVVLRYGYDLPYAQIADALGSSEEAARAAASSGVRRLRRTHERLA